MAQLKKLLLTRGHKNVVAGAIDERDVSNEFIMSFGTLARKGVFFRTASGDVSGGTGEIRVVALVDFRVGVTQLDGDVLFQFILESDGLYSRERLDDGGFAVSHVADGADVDGRLPTDHFRRQRRQRLDV